MTISSLVVVSSSKSVRCVRQPRASNNICCSAFFKKSQPPFPLPSSALFIRVEDSYSSRSRWGVWRSRDVLRAAGCCSGSGLQLPIVRWRQHSSLPKIFNEGKVMSSSRQTMAKMLLMDLDVFHSGSPTDQAA